MSGGNKILELNNDDAKKIIAAKMHLGADNAKYQMGQYIFKRAAGGANVFDIRKMWEKINLAARIIVAIENPADVCVVSAKESGQRAIIKFSKFTGSSQINGRFSPGTFTNHSQLGFREPRLLIVTDPIVDHQAVREASYVNIPVISLCDADTDLKYIDVCIPCNNKGANPIGLAWWFLTREVLRLRGTISRKTEWETMPDLFFFRNMEQIKEQEEEERKKAEEAVQAQHMDDLNTFQDDNAAKWDEPGQFEEHAVQEQDWATTQAQPADWSTEISMNAAAASTAAPKTQDWATTETTGTVGSW